jgi:hypothetical protein
VTAGLLVRQCVRTPGTELGQTCTEDFVEVGVETWLNAQRGDSITFAGDDGEVVSD